MFTQYSFLHAGSATNGATTAAAMGVSLEGAEPTSSELRQMQRVLLQWSNYIGSEREPHGTEAEEDRAARFSAEFRRFQEMAWLPQTGLADAATKERLRLVGDDPATSENIAQEFMRRGCQVALGFPEYSYFGSAETWVTGFVRALSNGKTVEQASEVAGRPLTAAQQQTLRFRGYSHDPQWAETLVSPARYGAQPQ